MIFVVSLLDLKECLAMYIRLAWNSPQHPECGEYRCVSPHLALSEFLFARSGFQKTTWKGCPGHLSIPGCWAGGALCSRMCERLWALSKWKKFQRMLGKCVDPFLETLPSTSPPLPPLSPAWESGKGGAMTFESSSLVFPFSSLEN